MRHTATLLLFVLFLCSCTHTPTRAERMEDKAAEYLQRTTHPMTDYVVAAKNLETNDTNFMGFISFKCIIGNQYSIYKIVFVSVKGDSIVYVGPSEETAMRALE